MAKDKVTKLKELAQRYLDSCSSWIQEKAVTQEGSALKEVLAVDLKDLPEYIVKHKNFPNSKAMALAKLKGEILNLNSAFVIDSLCDCTFDVDDYKAIGENDGMLKVASEIFSVLGMKEKSQECISWQYNADV
jgi:hypothetical protein